MRIGWYINRLRSMSPAEILHRLGEHRRKVVSKRRDDGWQRYGSPQLHPVFHGLRGAVQANASADQRQAITVAAADTLEGRFSALGRTWPPRDHHRVFTAEAWRLDPVSGTLWPGPEMHAFDVDFRSAGDRGDIKYVWEFNRLQQLPPLAVQWLLSGDGKCLEAIEAAIDSWHAANPPFRGVAWASGIEVALRAISLIVTLDIAGDKLAAATRGKTGEILAASAYWLPRFPSRFSSANNHLVAELAGEYLISLAFGSESVSARAALVAEVDKQILADGAGAEQTPTYAAFTAELILLCASAARQAGLPFPASVDARLAAFAEFAGWLPARGGGFGDDDEGRALTLGDEHDYVRSVAAAIHGYLGMAGDTPAPDDFRALFFGVPSRPVQAPDGLRTFAQGGLSVWHGDDERPPRRSDIRPRPAWLSLDRGAWPCRCAVTHLVHRRPAGAGRPRYLALWLGAGMAQLVPLHAGAQHPEHRGPEPEHHLGSVQLVAQGADGTGREAGWGTVEAQCQP
jgi:hypothetical protein